MKCDKCEKQQVIEVNARSKDMTGVTINGMEVHRGYAPGSIYGMDDETMGGDHVIITYCGVCGQILNGNFPLNLPKCFEESDQKNYDCEPCKHNEECNSAAW